MDFDEECAGGGYAPAASPRSGSRTPRKAKQQPPQETVRQFWEQFNTKFPGKVFMVLPDNPYARTKAAHAPKGVIQGQGAARSYEQARDECRRAVDRIKNECRRVNQKYTDPHFDIEFDLKSRTKDYLNGLGKENMGMQPKGVKRVTDIFENPQFYVNGPTASDVRQGRDGDCWVMAALCTMGNKEDLIKKICVAKDEQVGVYGFVFYRDGEWQQCIVDDKLYLTAADYDESVEERQIWDDINRADTEEEYRKVWQTGSRALYFAQCVDENETWLPLLEKAYAKAHGDYSSIEGGFVGEAIEDLTGGVTSEILTSNILDKDRFWKEELMKVNEEFLFGCGTGLFSNWLDPKYEGPPRDRRGIAENHSYSIMSAVEIDGQRLLKLRNPWGKKEWSGAWSDGSEQWTPQWMERLGHKFGNDGLFWISYDDLLKKYQHFDRTRLFGPEWTVAQQWTTLNVPWSADYHSTLFKIDVHQTTPVVIVLSQLDTRYFKGLSGKYKFVLKFRVHKRGEADYIVRSHINYLMSRSVNAEITLDPGRYYVLLKVTAYRHQDADSAEEVVAQYAGSQREKLVQIGLSYDLAHAKGLAYETEVERKEREERRQSARRKLLDETCLRLKKEWIRQAKMAAREQRAAKRRIVNTDHPNGAEPEKGLGIYGTFRAPAIDTPDSMGFGNTPPDTRDATNGTPSTLQQPFLTASAHSRRRTDSPRPSLDTRLATSGLEKHEEAWLEGFEFDPDLDMPPEEPCPSKAAHTHSRQDEGEGGDDHSRDPWNAVCVVGLRVYSKDPQLSLQVVRPVPEEDVGEATLDRDDPAASATIEKNAWRQRFVV